MILEITIFGGNYCYCHEASLNHTIRECKRFKALLQRMMDQRKIEFFERIMEGSINVITDAKVVGESSKGSLGL